MKLEEERRAEGADDETARDTEPPEPPDKPLMRSKQVSPLPTPAGRWEFVVVFSSVVLVRPLRIPLRAGEQSLGRDGDLALSDRSVSRKHAAIDLRDDELTIRDVGSRHGMKINGASVKAARLASGDVLSLGDTLLVLEHTGVVCAHQHAVSRARTSKLPVIIQGETGTGKDVLARKLHADSGRRGHFVRVDCACLPVSLAESELFGHAKGAYSGASGAREGLVRVAHEGTLFLDEIIELTRNLQAKLLRFLEAGSVRAVGTDHDVPVDARVIAASPIALHEAVERGRFRRDLYGRLEGREVFLPPLRQRRAEILSLFRDLAAELGAEFTLTRAASERLLLHPWPQNVRELKMLVGRAVEDVPIRPDGSSEICDNALAGIWPKAGATAIEHARSSVVRRRQPRVARDQLAQSLRVNRWNISRTARSLGRRRELVHRWVKEYGLRRDATDTPDVF
jgi:transcriptional regulator of acetoin/glycerol metabolism